MKTLDLYITKLCNLNCEYCYVDLKKNENSFNYEEFSERINLLDYDHIKFFGWEPLIKWTEIVKIIEIFKWKNKKFTIVTNGLLLDSKKLLFCVKNGVEVMISMHFKSIKKLLPKVTKFLFANEILWFWFIFEESKIDYPYKIVSFLVEKWFTHYILTPEVYWNWNEQNLKKLGKELQKFLEIYKKYPKVKFTWPSTDSLVKLVKWCSKNIVSKQWQKKPCNRFKSLDFFKENNVLKIFQKLEKTIDYENDPDKWFYVCPIWWYLDTLTLNVDLEKRIIQYKNLNQTFLKFYKEINLLQWKLNFLTEKIDEIRFNLTSQCNIRCSYCYVDFKNDKLDFLVAKNIIDYFSLKTWDKKTISFFGWEPLLQFELLKEIVKYSKKRFTEKNQKVFFKIATNFLLINQEKYYFLKENNFEIHISLNWDFDYNNAMRDNSSKLLFSKFDKYLNLEDRKKVLILTAFSNNEIEKLSKNLKFISELWFKYINLEMIFWFKYNWQKPDFVRLQREFIKIKKSSFYKNIKIISFDWKRNVLDISTKWICNDNSLEFNDYKADFQKQKIFKKLVIQNFQK